MHPSHYPSQATALPPNHRHHHLRVVPVWRRCQHLDISAQRCGRTPVTELPSRRGLVPRGPALPRGRAVAAGAAAPAGSRRVLCIRSTATSRVCCELDVHVRKLGNFSPWQRHRRGWRRERGMEKNLMLFWATWKLEKEKIILQR